VKLVLGTVGALALAVSLLGVGEAVQPSKKGGKKVIQGHDLVSRDKLAKLPDGKHHVRKTRAGHSLHVHAKDGKVAGISVTDSQGGHHKLKHRVVRRPARGARPVALDGNPLSAEELAALQEADLPQEGVPVSAQVGVSVVVIFTFTPPTPRADHRDCLPGRLGQPRLIIIV